MEQWYALYICLHSHVCVSEVGHTFSGNGLLHGQLQAITGTTTGLHLNLSRLQDGDHFSKASLC